jgi:hypothetical protein
VLAGIGAGMVTLYLTLVVVPHPWGMHGAVWSLLVNGTLAVVVSGFTRGPSSETVARIHGEVERFVYGSGDAPQAIEGKP